MVEALSGALRQSIPYRGMDNSTMPARHGTDAEKAIKDVTDIAPVS
jgi:hypothetical protein